MCKERNMIMLSEKEMNEICENNRADEIRKFADTFIDFLIENDWITSQIDEEMKKAIIKDFLVRYGDGKNYYCKSCYCYPPSPMCGECPRYLADEECGKENR